MHLDRNSIADVLETLRQQRPLSESFSLPPQGYYSPAFYQLETERIFSREWVCVGHQDEVPAPGDFFTTELVGEQIIIIRDASGVRALSNVCRHRCSQLLEGRANVERIVCPYHGWTYGLDGRLLKTTYMEQARGFEPSNLCLPALRLEVWNGYLYLNLDDGAEPLAPRLDGLTDLIGHFHIDEMRYHFFGESMWEANWKIITENFSENYHTHRVHPDSLNLSNPTRMTKMLGGKGTYHVHLEPYNDEREPLPGSFHPDVPPSERNHVVLFAVFPSATYGAHARRTFSFVIHPMGPERSRVKWGLATREDMSGEQLEEMKNIYVDIIEEDHVVIERLQRALKSRRAAPGPLSHLEQSAWDLYHYLGEHLLSG